MDHSSDLNVSNLNGKVHRSTKGLKCIERADKLSVHWGSSHYAVYAHAFEKYM